MIRRLTSSLSRKLARVHRHARWPVRIIIAHLLLIFIFNLTIPQFREVFPIFKWSLFSWTPEQNSYFDVKLQIHNTETYESPKIDLTEAPGFSMPFDHKPFLRFLGKKLLQDKNSPEAQKYLAEFERRYISPISQGYYYVSYYFVKTTAHPIEYYKNSDFVSEQTFFIKTWEPKRR